MGFLNTLDLNTIVGFLKDNWDEVTLLWFNITQLCRVVYWSFNYSEQPQYYWLFHYGPIYFSTVLFLISSLFFNKTWLILTGFVTGVNVFNAIYDIYHYSHGDLKRREVILNSASAIFLCVSVFLI